LNGNETTTVQTEWLVINKTYDLYAEIRNSDPLEYDETDNSIRTKLCGGPYFNLLVEANGQGIIQKTPNLNRYEGVQAVTVTAIPATGWVFDSWQGDATGFTNPLTVNLTSDQVIFAVFIEPLVAPIVTDGTQCGPGTVTLTASGAVGAQSYRWYTTAVGGTPIANETNAIFTTPALTTNTSYFVSIASFSNESTRAEVQAIILPQPAQPTVVATGQVNCPTAANPAVLQAPSGFNGYLWSTGETTQQIEVTTAGTYTVQVLDANNCASIPSAGFTVTEEFCNELIVYNAISPDNGDDLNDYLIIRNIDILADARENKLKIYNRWGDLVFETTNYDNVTNPFKGQTNNGKELPSGNYFYILEFNSNRPRMTGYISLKR
jgi:gliding motility-associated-like protein